MSLFFWVHDKEVVELRLCPDGLFTHTLQTLHVLGDTRLEAPQARLISLGIRSLHAYSLKNVIELTLDGELVGSREVGSDTFERHPGCP